MNKVVLITGGSSGIGKETVYKFAKNGYDASAIATSINKGINNGLLVGVDHVEPKDINVKKDSKAVGVY